KEPYAHGYGELDARRIDLTGVDPSMADAAGGSALVTTVHDLAAFMDALLAGRLFRHRDTLRQMLAFAPAPDQGGQVGYGLGIERRVVPGGVEMMRAVGRTPGFCAYVGRIRPPGATIASVMNWEDDPTPLLVPAVKVLA